MQHDAMTREQAANAGLHKYWSGSVCRKGHEAMRYTATGACIDCVAGYRAKFRQAAPGTVNVVTRCVPRHLEEVFAQRAGALLHQLIAQSARQLIPTPMLPPPPTDQARLPDGTVVTVTRDYVLEHGDPVVLDGMIVGHQALSDEEKARVALGF